MPIDSRFIPACAGNARQCCRPCDHCVGSSPRVRGTLARADWRRRAAVHPRVCGERILAVNVALSCAVHPRVCGERTPRADVKSLGGSSPRVRGTRSRRQSDCNIGSSPRVRGTPFRRPLRPAPFTVHPRVCGERLYDPASQTPMRRFIPACAGNARLPSCSRCC